MHVNNLTPYSPLQGTVPTALYHGRECRMSLIKSFLAFYFSFAFEWSESWVGEERGEEGQEEKEEEEIPCFNLKLCFRSIW